jgi:YegS/Rv2252/BmrU family lipid kinase
MRTLVVINPVAGNGRAWRVWERARTGIADGCTWEIAATTRVGHATELARGAAEAGYERVVAVGGDGTVCEVANGLAGSTTAVGIVPAGTGNDCAANLGLPRDPCAAARLAFAGQPRPIDLGHITTTTAAAWFVNIAGFGFDAEVTWRLNRLRRLGSGTVPYVIGVIQTLFHFAIPRMRVTLDGRAMDTDVFLVAVANGPSYGGGMRIAPDAAMDDGILDICVVRAISRSDVLRLVPRMYSGGHRDHPAVEFYRCRELLAESSNLVRCQADGQPLGPVPARFTVQPRGLLCITGRASAHG